MVHAFGRFIGRPALDVMGVDNRACGQMAAATMLARWYWRAGFPGGPQGATSMQDSFAGFRVPLDVGIPGMNDIEMAGWPTVNLTTIRQPIPEIIQASIDTIEAALHGNPTPPATRLFACHITERGTLRPLPADRVMGQE